jgi:hypothetical protein
LMKGWRCWFMRCRRRLEPCGSHHSEARVLKWETSVWLTELPAWLVVLGGWESVVCLRIEHGVRGMEVMAARTKGCVATSRRKGAGSERRVLGGIVAARERFVLFPKDLVDDEVQLPRLATACPAWRYT